MTKTLKAIFATAMLATALSASALQESYYTTKSLLAEGHWAKVKVTQNGINQLTYEQLRQAGFDNPEKVTVYGFGGNLLAKDEFSVSYPDDVKQIYSIHNGDRILFYGESDVNFLLNSNQEVKIRRNYQANEGYYFITDSQPVTETTPINYIAYSSPTDITSHSAIKVSQPDFYSLVPAGCKLFSENAMERSDKKLVVPFDVSDREEGSNAYCAISLILNTPISASINYGFNNTLFTYKRTGATPLLWEKTSGQFSVPDADITENENILALKITPLSTAFKYLGYEKATVVYTRKNSLGDRAQLPMAYYGASTGYRYVLEDAVPGTTEVWFVKDPAAVRPFKSISLSETSITYTLDRAYSGTGEASGVYMIAFDPNKAQYPAEIIENVENQDIHGAATPDMLIITTDVCEEQAIRLAQLHKQYQGIDVLVVNQRKVFNEFSSGTPSVMAYRRAAKMFYDRDSSKFKNLLIFGSASYDNRHKLPEHAHHNISNTSLIYNCIATEQQRSDETNYANDAYFGILVDNYVSSETQYNTTYYAMSIGVGRIPAQNEGDAKAYVDKVERNFANPVPFGAYSRMLFLADDGDSDSHASAAEECAELLDSLDSRVTSVKVYDGFYVWKNNSAAEARRMITSNLSSGTGLFFYTGHGKTDAFTATDLWHRNYAKNVKYEYAPFAYLSTCHSYAFDQQENSIAENMLFNNEGGKIALIGAGRSVYQDMNQLLALAFFDAYCKADRNITFGEVFRDARNYVCGNASNGPRRINTHCYNLGGDPALYVDRPNRNIVISTVNGSAATQNVAIEPLTETTIKGYVTDENGNADSSFSGILTAAVYDGAYYAHNLYQDGSTGNKCKVDSILMDETILAQTSAKVINGQFEVKIIVPAPSVPGVKNRIVVGACSDDNKKIALGGIPDAVVNNYNPEIEHVADSSAPEIRDMYINNDNFRNGDVVVNDARFYATVYDESGINISTGASRIRLIVDNIKSMNTVQDLIRYNEDGSITISYDFTELSDGKHDIKLLVADNLGNIAEQSLSMVFVKVADASLSVQEEPAVTEATFDFSHNLSGDVTSSISIETLDGKTVFTDSNITFPFTWNLKDNDGNAIPAGNYRAFVKAATESKNHTAASTTFVVVKL